jgi:hypothetical protein
MFKMLASRGVIVALLTVAAVVAGYFGKAELAEYLKSPELADGLVLVIGTVGTIAAGVMQGVRPKPVQAA